MNKLMLGLGCLILTISFSFSAWAQTDDQVIIRKKTKIEFAPEFIDGDLSTPDTELIRARQRYRHQSLIRVRETFRPLVLQSVVEMEIR